MAGLHHFEGELQWPPLPPPFPHARPLRRPILHRNSLDPALNAVRIRDQDFARGYIHAASPQLAETMPSYHTHLDGHTQSSLPPPPSPLPAFHSYLTPAEASTQSPASEFMSLPYSATVSVSPQSPTWKSAISSSGGIQSGSQSHRYTTMDSDHAHQTAQLAAAASIFKSLKSAHPTPKSRPHTVGRSSLREYLKKHPVNSSVLASSSHNTSGSVALSSPVTPSKSGFSRKFEAVEKSSSVSQCDSGRLGRTLRSHRIPPTDITSSASSSWPKLSMQTPTVTTGEVTPHRPLRGTKSMTFLEKPFARKTATRFGGNSRATFLRTSSFSQPNRLSEASTVVMTKKPYNIRRSVRLSSASTDMGYDMSSPSVATDKSQNLNHGRFLHFLQTSKKKALASFLKRPQQHKMSLVASKGKGIQTSSAVPMLGSVPKRRGIRKISWLSTSRSSMVNDGYYAEDISRPSTNSTNVAELSRTATVSTATEDDPYTPTNQISEFYSHQFEYRATDLSPSIHTVRIVHERPALQHPSPQSPENKCSPQNAFFRTSPTFRTTIRRQMDEEEARTSSAWKGIGTTGYSTTIGIQAKNEDIGAGLLRARSTRDDTSSVYSSEYQMQGGLVDIFQNPMTEEPSRQQSSHSMRNPSLTSSADWNMIPESISSKLWAQDAEGSTSTPVYPTTTSRAGHGHIRERAHVDDEDEPMFGYGDQAPPSVVQSIRSAMRSETEEDEGHFEAEDIAMKPPDQRTWFDYTDHCHVAFEPSVSISAERLVQAPQPCVVEELARHLKDVTLENRQEAKLKRSTSTKSPGSPAGWRPQSNGKIPKQSHATRNRVSPGRRMAESFLENRRRQQEPHPMSGRGGGARRDFSGAFI
ncbi:hypothetical protein BROUX41_000963 [Berkeleyomyces rouxiae]